MAGVVLLAITLDSNAAKPIVIISMHSWSSGLDKQIKLASKFCV
jgi:hypothetical protein